MATTEQEAAALALEQLTPQQRKFVEAYCIEGCRSATSAAVVAGYSPKTAAQQASRLLRNVKVFEAVQALATATAMGAGEIAARWDQQAKATIDDFYVLVQVPRTTQVLKPLAEVVAAFRREIDFEQEMAMRAESLLTGKEQEAHRKREHRKHQERKLRLMRMEFELEQEPNATRLVDGPMELRDELKLDLEGAKKAGLLKLVKGIKPAMFGNAVEMRDPDHAQDNLAKWRGMFTEKVDITTKGESVAPKHDPAKLAAALSPEQLAALRAAHETLGT